MKIALRKNDQGKVIGWSMERESDDELSTIEIIRDMYFWGSVEYDGRVSESKISDNTKTLNFLLEVDK